MKRTRATIDKCNDTFDPLYEGFLNCSSAAEIRALKSANSLDIKYLKKNSPMHYKILEFVANKGLEHFENDYGGW